MTFRWGRHCLDFTGRTLVMGVLNVTPDSFSDGGLFYASRDAAISHAIQMAEDGADIIDIGGLSTRPGSEPVSVQQETDRVAPVIEALSNRINVPVSIDTYRSEVARAALDAGASIVNDISGLRFDPAMAAAAASYGVPVVVMHIKGTPRDMQQHPEYEALVPEVMDYLREGIRIAEEAGITNIIIDPGIGFGKTYDHNLQLLASIGEFVKLGYPVLAGPSRKAFIGAILGGIPAQDRIWGTAAAVAACVLGGAHIVRVHDVKEMAQVVKVASAIRSSSMPSQASPRPA